MSYVALLFKGPMETNIKFQSRSNFYQERSSGHLLRTRTSPSSAIKLLQSTYETVLWWSWTGKTQVTSSENVFFMSIASLEFARRGGYFITNRCCCCVILILLALILLAALIAAILLLCEFLVSSNCLSLVVKYWKKAFSKSKEDFMWKLKTLFTFFYVSYNIWSSFSDSR